MLDVHRGSLLIRLNQIHPKHPVSMETAYLSAPQMNLPINNTALLAPRRCEVVSKHPELWRNAAMAFGRLSVFGLCFVFFFNYCKNGPEERLNWY